MRNFRDFEIYHEAIDLVKDIYQVASLLPADERYGLISQMKRCAVSIPSNIAEGSRGSNKELTYFLNISLGSSFELETQLDIANKLNMLEKSDTEKIFGKINALQRRINAFKKSVRNS